MTRRATSGRISSGSAERWLRVRRVAKEFKAFFQKVRLPGGDYTMDHSVAIYVLDKQARVRLMFTADRKLEDIAHDILNSHATP